VSSDDRPKKSWKEIDAARDRSGGSTKRRDPEESAREKAAKSAAYSKYKSQLDKLFKPGGTELPEQMKAKLGPTSEDSKKNREAADALRKSPSEETLSAYLETGQVLPDDPRLLTGLLDIKNEALMAPVLKALLELVEAGKKPNRMLLIQRLEAAKRWVEDEATLELLNDLRDRIE
jgi:hypothetical protein